MSEKRHIGMLVAVETDSVFARYGTPGKTERRSGFEVFQYENEAYKLYNTDKIRRIKPDAVITEDSNSGHQCFELIYDRPCEAAGGKSKVYDKIRKAGEGQLLVIVDGAAFGSEMGKVSRYLKQSNKDCTLYAPESFEYLILRAGLLDVSEEILSETYKYADSCKYLSWEEFFTSYLVEISSGTVYRYSKSSLGEAYKTAGTIKKIISILPEKIRPEKEE